MAVTINTRLSSSKPPSSTGVNCEPPHDVSIVCGRKKGCGQLLHSKLSCTDIILLSPTKYRWGYTNRKFARKLSVTASTAYWLLYLHLQLKQEGLGSIPSGSRGFFHFQLAYTNVDVQNIQKKY